MTRFLLLDRGEELSEANAGALTSAASPLRLRLLTPASPFRAWEILHVGSFDGGAGPRPGGLFLCREGPGFFIRSRRGGPGSDPPEILGRVVAIERGEVVLSLERGVLPRLPARWLPAALDLLEALGKFRHPLRPELFQGGADACLAGVMEKYNRQAEARQYSVIALTGLDPFELEIVQRHVKPRGRILDIGCGAGREAVGFSRLGFQAVGIDIAPHMIEAATAHAAREGLAITFRIQSVTELAEPAGTFDGAYWPDSYYHVPGRALRVETLRRIARALTPDGVLILGLAGYRGSRSLLSRARFEDLLRRVGRLRRKWNLSEPGDFYIRDVSEASDPGEPCFFHEFSGPEEVRAEIEAAGLSAEEATRAWWVCRPAIR